MLEGSSDDRNLRQLRPLVVGGINGIHTRNAAGLPEYLTGSGAELMACLIAAGPGGVGRDELLEALDLNDGGALRTQVSRLREKLADGTVPNAGSAGIYRLDLRLEQVDIWSIVELAGDSEAVIDEADLEWILAGRAYGNVELPGAEDMPKLDLLQARAVVARAQRRLVERYCTAGHAHLSFAAAELLQHFSRAERYDEDLAVRVASFLSRSGQRAEAIKLLEWVGESLQGIDVVPVESAALLERLRMQPNVESSLTMAAVHAKSYLPPQLKRLRGDRFVGRQEEIDRLRSGACVLLLGPRGSGKTHLLAELAAGESERGNAVTYIAAQEDADVDLAPFISAFPELTEVLADAGRFAETPDDADRAVLASFASAVFDRLEASPNSTKHRVLIDDAHWLDRRSAQLVSLLAHSHSSRRLVVAVVGRNDEQNPIWIQLQQRLARAGAVTIELGGLDLDSLHELIGLTHRSTTDQARHALAVELLELTGGLPWPVRRVLDAVDPTTLAIPADFMDAGDASWVASDFSGSTRAVGLAAAVLGLSFDINDVESLSERSRQEVEDAIDQLVLADVVDSDGEDESRFAFRHVLMQESFRNSAPPFLVRRLNLAAAQRTSDPHAKARYIVRGGQPYSDAVRWLRESGVRYSAERQWLSAAEQFRLIEGIDAAALTAVDYTMFAEALDLSGQDGAGARGKAFELAAEAHDWDQALAAVTSGLAGAEPPDGDPGRLAMLQRIPDDGLKPEAKFKYAEHFARRLALTGHASEGAAWADRALALAGRSEERVAAHLCRWTARHHLTPEGYEFPPGIEAEASGPARLRMSQMKIISALEAGRSSEAMELHRVLRSEAIAQDDSLRIWHTMCFDALLAFDQGRWHDANQLSERAYRYGLVHDHQEALPVRVGQGFHQYYVCEREGELLGLLDGIPSDVRRSGLARAMYALCVASAGDEKKGIDLAVDLVGEALEGFRSGSIPIIGMLGSLVARSGDSQLRRSARSALLPFADSSIVIGFGIANMGPLWRYLAPLADHAKEHELWLQKALQRSRELDMLSWKVLNGRAVVDACDTGELLQAEIEQWSAGTDIGRIAS